MDDCEVCGCELTDDQSDFAESTGVALCDECAEQHHDDYFEDHP